MIDAPSSNNALLVLLTFLGSAVSWWPAFVEPGIDLPFWAPLACAALCTGLSATLAPGSWPLLLLASGLGTFGGLYLSIMIWPPSDPIVSAWIPSVSYFAAAITLAAVFVALTTGLIMRRRSISNAIARRAVWAGILVCFAFGPVMLALTPAVVRHRISRNERLAAERLALLKRAVESTEYSQICDGTALQQHYSGPPFSDTDWRRMTGNAVKQDGYYFMVYCREKGGYTVAVSPARERIDGTRRFCTDESGKVGCGVEFDGSRYKCLPCPK